MNSPEIYWSVWFTVLILGVPLISIGVKGIIHEAFLYLGIALVVVFAFSLIHATMSGETLSTKQIIPNKIAKTSKDITVIYNDVSWIRSEDEHIRVYPDSLICVNVYKVLNLYGNEKIQRTLGKCK